jgi:hypothetical protein
MPSNPAPPGTTTQADAALSGQTAAAAAAAGDAEKQFADLSKRIADLSGQINIAAGALDGLKAGFEKAKTAGADLGLEKLNAGLNKLTQSAILKSTQEVSEMILDITGMNATAIGQAAYGVKGLTKDLADSSYEILNEYGKKKITLLNGISMDAAALLGDSKEFLSSYKDAVLNDTRLFNAGVEGMTEEVVENTRLATESLRMQPSEINEIFQRELSATGKISGEMLKTYEKTVLAVAQATGEVPYKISQDLARMTSDFNHFGALTIEQMGSLSATVHRLGLDISDVTRLSDQFSSFDKAAQTMSNLAASTGATLDTLELFRLANTDQEQFIVSLRDQLESQGIEFENMNILQQKQIAGAFGIDPVVLQRLLNDNFDTIGGLKEDIQGRVRGMSDTDMETALVDMGDLVKKAQELSATELADRIASLTNASADYAKTIENSVRSTVFITDRAVETMIGARENTIKTLKDVQGILDTINESTVEAFGGKKGSIPQPKQPPKAGPPATPPAPAPVEASPQIPAPEPTTSGTPIPPAPAPTTAPAATSPMATTTPTAGSSTTAPAVNPASPAGSTVAYIPTNQETRAEAMKAGETPFGGVIAPATASQTATPQKREEPASSQKGSIPPAPAPEPAPPQKVEITLKLVGGDLLGAALAPSIVAASISGVNVGGTTVHLVTAEKTDTPSVA